MCALRIIAGSLKGRELQSPAGRDFRPMSSQVRNALFNMLAPELAGARVLDMYAGSGAVGLEAFSRGVAEVVFVDCDCAVLTESLRRLALQGRLAVLEGAADEMARYLVQKAEKFDIIIADPPYQDYDFELYRRWRLEELLERGGMAVFSHGARDGPPGEWPGMALEKEKDFGDTRLTAWRKS